MTTINVKATELSAAAEARLEGMDMLRAEVHKRNIEKIAREHRKFSWWRGSVPAPLSYEEADKVYSEDEDIGFPMKWPSQRRHADAVMDDDVRRAKRLLAIADAAFHHGNGFVDLDADEARFVFGTRKPTREEQAP